MVSTLGEMGWQTTVVGRENMLDALEIHGFTTADQGNRGRQRVAVPVVYHYVARMEELQDYLKKLRADIGHEAERWSLAPRSASTTA